MAKESEVCAQCGKKFQGIFGESYAQRHFRQRELCNDCAVHKRSQHLEKR